MQKTANCNRRDHAMSNRVACLQPDLEEKMAEDSQLIKRQRSLLLPAQMLRIMRMTTIIMLIFCLHVSARSSSQNISLTGKNLSMKEVFAAIENQTGFNVWGKTDFLENSRPVTVSVNRMPLTDFLDLVMMEQPYSYKLADNTIILSEKASIGVRLKVNNNALKDDFLFINITGLILNVENNEKISGATISVKGSRGGVTSDASGQFILPGVAMEGSLIISSVGFKSIEVSVQTLSRIAPLQTLDLNGGSVRKIPNGTYIFSLSPARAVLNEVVINNGMFSRSKDNYTGAATVFTGADLRTTGNKNIIESLKTLDPSFIKLENNLQGSNPNKLPQLEVRGKTTLSNTTLNDQFNSNPNQPLFILDGFETTLQTIYDLDMNRVASISLLKDAASTSLYGSKAANGVVVVETKRPVPGRLQVSYVEDYNFDLPDLTSYNMMNSSERLTWEKLTSYNYTNDPKAWEREARNSARIADVARGVNTYWLREPVRMGLTNKHSLQLNGGNNDLIFNAGGVYSNQNGIMKGSGRQTYSGNMSLTYRKGRFNITEMATVGGATGNESPYGSFANFTSAIPYYRKTNADGSISKKLDNVYDTLAINPLYNASLFSINQSKTFAFTNNIRGIYTLSNSIRLEGGIQLAKGNSNTVVFTPPDNTAFDGIEPHQKGSYVNSHGENHSYTTYVSAAYGKVIGKGQFSANARGQISSTTSESIGFSVVGYPYGTNGNPAFAYGYTPYSTPVSGKVTGRSVSLATSVNYSYDGRFMVDAVYNLSGTSAFGSNKRYKPFVSGGLGWNIGREAFLRDLKWMNLLKLRGNIGYSGNENLGNFTSVSTYSFLSGNNNNFGQGLTLSSLGSPNLEWSRTLNKSYGLDFSFLNSRITGSLEYYDKNTDPLAVPADGTLPSSVAVNNRYVINVGNLVAKGWNFSMRYSPIYDLKNRIVWSLGVTGVKTTNLYGGFSNKLAALNKEEQNSQGLSRYYDGYSPDDIWTVVSRGIDPATGAELFEKKNGMLSFTYDPADVVRVGNTRPKIEGLVNTSFSYKDFFLNVSARYRIGGYVFNDALYSKVENTGTTLVNGVTPNLDKRALYNRWQKPGDVTEFSKIGIYSGAPMSSRFIQKDTHFIGESFNLGWRSSASWIRNLHLQTIGVNLYLNDIFRIESIQTERGLTYPFARTASFSVNVSF